MARHTRSTGANRRRRAKVLARLEPDESAAVLRLLLDRHPEIAAEAEELARGMVTGVDAGALAEEVEQAVTGPDLDDLGSRSGRHSWGYVEPTEAAWDILQEALDPFLADMKRHIDLGFETAATMTCAGIVLGLYRCRGKGSDRVLGWAEDFPAESAGNAVSTLVEESGAQHERAWTLPVAVVDQVPEWAAMIERCERRSRGR